MNLNKEADFIKDSLLLRLKLLHKIENEKQTQGNNLSLKLQVLALQRFFKKNEMIT
jgi:hypothetical protein